MRKIVSEIRYSLEDGENWYSLRDVCRILSKDVKWAIAKLQTDEIRKVVDAPLKTHGLRSQDQRPWAINTRGIFRLMLQSESLAAKKLKDDLVDALGDKAKWQSTALVLLNEANEPAEKQNRMITAEDVKQWIAWREDGKTLSQIAKTTGVTRGMVSVYTTPKTMPKKFKRALGIAVG